VTRQHVHATTRLRAGVPVHVVAARLGHADPSITLRAYAHVISEQLAEAAVISDRRRPNRFNLDQSVWPVLTEPCCTTVNCNPNCNPVRWTGMVVIYALRGCHNALLAG
jgi:hypothetical protein